MRLLPLAPALVLFLALAAPADAAALGNAVYAANGAVSLADFSYSGPCNGAGTVTLVIHSAGGDQTLSAGVTSSAVGGTCGAGLRCLDCPPVPEAFAWELKGPGVLLVGGGPADYDTYADHALAFQLQGAFLGGELEAHGLVQL